MHKNALAPTSKFNFVGQPYSDSNTSTFQVLSKCVFPTDGSRQGTYARKVNCGCVYSAYILKPVTQFSLGGICKQG